MAVIFARYEEFMKRALQTARTPSSYILHILQVHFNVLTSRKTPVYAQRFKICTLAENFEVIHVSIN